MKRVMRVGLVLLLWVGVVSTASAEIIEAEFLDGDGDGSMWLCQQPRGDDDTTGVIRVDTSGYFVLTTTDDTMFDSGDHQRNEAYFLLIKNSRNPDGYPIDPNCGSNYILQDQVAVPAPVGTFYLEAGEDNIVEMHHYCDLWRAGECHEFYDPEGEAPGGCYNCESVSLVLHTISFERERSICDPGDVAISTEDWCDGLDNDCDGQVDEDGGPDCTQCESQSAEICDGEDNDCDGLIDEDDEGLLCGPGEICTLGACHQECRGYCEAGECVDGICLSEPCSEGVYCGVGESCVSGACVNLCEGLLCPLGTTCDDGSCVDPSCHTYGCPNPGEICVDADCVADPCVGVSCDGDAFCRDGLCVGSCAGVNCAAGEVCTDGACRPDNCADVSCGPNQVCSAGACYQDPCLDVQCPSPLVCMSGVCVGNPCETIQCAEGQGCFEGQCYGEAEAEELQQSAQDDAGGEGLPGSEGRDVEGSCACHQVTQGRELGLHGVWLALLVSVGLLWSRRRSG